MPATTHRFRTLHQRRSPIRLSPYLSYILAALVIAVALFIAVGASRTEAQEGETASWAFAPNLPFVDTRVSEAFFHLMDVESVASDAGVTLEYGVEGVEFGTPPEDAPLLLQAAGIMSPDGGPLSVVEERPCAVWASNDDLAPVAEALGVALVAALADLELEASDCEVANEPAEADLLVWAEGEQPEEFDPFAEGEAGFLSLAPMDGEPPAEGGQGGGSEGDGKADSPDPAVGGFGVFDDTSEVIPAWLIGLVAVAAVLAAARVATGRLGR